jgi:hypothetical protein
MGSKVYDFLSESFLFNSKFIQDSFSSLSEAEIRNELNKYREHCIVGMSDIVSDIGSDRSSLKVFPDFKTMDINLLKQCALYVDKFVLYDPLFNFTYQPDEKRVTALKAFGGNEKGIDRKQLTSALRFLKKITPMVAANFIKIYPTSYHFEPSEPMYSRLTNFYGGAIPKEVREFFHNNVDVKSLKPDSNRPGAFIFDDKLNIARVIGIKPKNHPSTKAELFFLTTPEIKILDEEAGLPKNIRMGFDFNRLTDPIEQNKLNEWKTWVIHSIDTVAYEFFQDKLEENIIASQLGAVYMSNSDFVADLMKLTFSTKEETSQIRTLKTLLKFDLPFLDNIKTESLMKVRTDDGEVFANFRALLDKNFRELRTITDEDQLRIKIENIFEDMTQNQVLAINQKMQSFKRKSFAKCSALLMGVLSAAILNPANLTLASIAAMVAGGYLIYEDYRDVKDQNASFLLWKTLEKRK